MRRPAPPAGGGDPDAGARSPAHARRWHLRRRRPPSHGEVALSCPTNGHFARHRRRRLAGAPGPAGRRRPPAVHHRHLRRARRASRTVLVDLGRRPPACDMRHRRAATCSRRPGRAAGIRPADVTDVVFTHLRRRRHRAGPSVERRAARSPTPRRPLRRGRPARAVVSEQPGTPRSPTLMAAGAPTADGDVGRARGRSLPGIDGLGRPGPTTPGSDDHRAVVGHRAGRSLARRRRPLPGAARRRRVGPVVFDVDRRDGAPHPHASWPGELEGDGVQASGAHFPGLRFGRLLRAEGRRRWCRLTPARPASDRRGRPRARVTPAMQPLDAIFKAYDIRGTVPDQLDADVVPRASAPPSPGSSPTATAPTGSSSPATCARRASSSSAAFAEGVTGQGVDVVDLGLASTDLIYFAAGKLDAPGRHVHRVAQPGAVQRHQAVPGRRPPVGEDTGLAEIKAHGRRPASPPAARRGTVSRARPPRRLRRPRPLLRRPSVAAAAQGRGRHRQRHGRPRGARGVRRPAVRPRVPVPRARRHVPEPPGRPDPAREPSATCRPGSSRPAPTSASPSTATPTACSSSTSRAEPVSGSPTTALVAHGDARQAPGRHDPPQPDLLEGGARGHPRARRHAGAHPGRPLVHQAGDGRDRRRLRRRALGATTTSATTTGPTPGSSPRWSCSSSCRVAGVPLSELRAPFERYAAVGRDQHRGRRPGRGHRAGGRRLRRPPTRTASTASPSTSATGGSTSGRRTPSRCCASTSRPPDREPSATRRTDRGRSP